jgi:hypothetical protein
VPEARHPLRANEVANDRVFTQSQSVHHPKLQRTEQSIATSVPVARQSEV